MSTVSIAAVNRARHVPVAACGPGCARRRQRDRIRAVNKQVSIIAGLATDEGSIPVTAAIMVREYRLSYQCVQGFWLNANQWDNGPADRCQRTGCGAIGRAFLTATGVRR
jgi:hypothetical protein